MAKRTVKRKSIVKKKRAVTREVSIRQMAADLAAIRADTKHIRPLLDRLFRFTARNPDGQSLISLVDLVLIILRRLEKN